MKKKKVYVAPKSKKEKKGERQERLMKFRTEILPDLESYYEVQVHGSSNAPATMYKIIVTSSKSYDYYPMGQKMRINTQEGYRWVDMTVDEILVRIKSLPIKKRG